MGETSMLAEFFCLPEDAPKASLIQEHVRQQLDKNVDLSVRVVEDSLEVAERYRKLLQATIPPHRALSTYVTLMNWYSARIYVQIFWPIYAEGYRSEIAGTSVFFEGYHIRRCVTAYPNGKGMELFFPAIALRDKMVIVPRGQGQLLNQIGMSLSADAATQTSASAFIDAERDVVEVNFADSEDLHEAIQSVAIGLRRELRHDVFAYRNYQYDGVEDLTKAALDLGVTPHLIKQALDEHSLDTANMYSQLSCRFDQEKLLQGRWTKATLYIHNDSEMAMEGIVVTVAGPVELLPSNIETNLAAKRTTEVAVSLRPHDVGVFPLEIGLAARAVGDLAPLMPRHIVWFESLPE
jgi:hypothetical protein